MSGPGRRSALESDERWARVAVSFLVEPRHRGVCAMLADTGGAATLAALRERRAGSDGGLYVRLPELDLDALAARADSTGTRVLVPGDPQWPAALDRLDEPPYCLYVRGEPDLAALTERAVALVGARAATEYGLRVAADLGEGLAGRGWAVVSGAAFGIDAAAHRGALAGEGETVAVLACGADLAYPKAHEPLLERIVERGAVLSEVPPGATPFRGRFLARNRLIAALARATVVVEAGLRSGSLSTANEAARVHLPVGAVPGPVTSATSAGCHELVRRGVAAVVCDTADVLELAAPIGQELAPVRVGPSRPTDALDPVQFAVWSAAPLRRYATAGRLAVLAGADEARLPGALAVLEVLGLLERRGDGWRKAAVPQAEAGAR